MDMKTELPHVHLLTKKMMLEFSFYRLGVMIPQLRFGMCMLNLYTMNTEYMEATK